jgi:hypothetical protein
MWLLAFSSALMISTLYAYYLMFSRFSIWDDEGYVLLSLKYFFNGHPLYDEVYSSFQPFCHWFYKAIFGLWGVPLCHDNMRLLTMAIWLAGAALTSFTAYRLSNSLLAGFIVFVLTVQYLRSFANEPGHPQSVAYLLVSAVVALISCLGSIRSTIISFGVGALIGLLTLTKINIGIYTTVGVAFMLFTGNSGAFSILAQRAVGAGMVLLPLAFIFPRLPASFWCMRHIGILGCLTLIAVAPVFIKRNGVRWCLVLCAGIISLCLTEPYSAHLYEFYFGLAVACSAYCTVFCSHPFNLSGWRLGNRNWLWIILGSAMVVITILACTIHSGTSFQGLVDGLFLMPMNLSRSYKLLPYFADPEMTISPLADLVLFSVYIHARSRYSTSRWFDRFLTCARTFLAVFVIFGLGTVWSPTLLTFSWLLLTSVKEAPRQLARIGILAVTIMQPLLAFPVAGSQCASGGVLMILVAVVCLADAFYSFREQVNIQGFHLFRPAVSAVAVISILFSLGAKTLELSRRHASLTPLELPGAVRIRLERPQVDVFKKLVCELERPEVDTFLTLPGLCSLYLWARKAPPTGFNVSFWMGLLDDHCQERVWEAAISHSGLVVVRNTEAANLWRSGMNFDRRPFDEIPLVHNISTHFKAIHSIGDYEVMVRR